MTDILYVRLYFAVLKVHCVISRADVKTATNMYAQLGCHEFLKFLESNTLTFARIYVFRIRRLVSGEATQPLAEHKCLALSGCGKLQEN
jgi:hypothetical protein